MPLHGKLQYRKSMLNYSLSCSFSVRLVMLFGPLKDGVPSLFSFQSIQSQNAVYLLVSVWDQQVLYPLDYFEAVSSVFCGLWGYHDAERNAANRHGCLFHVKGSFLILAYCVFV